MIKKYNIDYESLDFLLEILKKNGANKKDYKDVIFKVDYEGCYYEGDQPSITVYWNKKRKEKTI